jgi:uncharacterized protein YkwD
MKLFRDKIKPIIYAGLIIAIFTLTGCPDHQQSGNDSSPNYLNKNEKSIYTQINNYRLSNGLTPLQIDTHIVDQARKHSRDMANGVTPFGHEGFNERVAATHLNYQAAAENVAYNQGQTNPTTAAVQGWIQSEGHRQNIKGSFNLTGIGMVKNQAGKYYFTQIFILSKQQGKGSGWFQ